MLQPVAERTRGVKTPSLVPRPFLRGRKNGLVYTYCWRVRLVLPRNLDTPRILSVFPNSNPSFYVRILHLCECWGRKFYGLWYSMQESSLKRCTFRRWSRSSSCWRHPLETTSCFRSFSTILSRYSCVSLAIALSFS